MKKLFLKLCKLGLAVLGTSWMMSCSAMLEYGTPFSKFEVKCKVIDSETKAPVKGIMLTPGEKRTFKDDIFIAISEGVVSNTGIFELSGTNYYDPHEIQIKLTDLDPKKHGHYKDSIYVVPLEKLRDSKQNWNSGTFGADITIEAKQVEEEILK